MENAKLEDVNLEELEDKKMVKKQKFKPWQVALVAVASLAVIAGLTFLVVNELNKNKTQEMGSTEVETGVASADFSNATEHSVTLKDGENEITGSGTYTVTGSTSNGYIHVNAGGKIQLVLDNVSITNPSGPAIYVETNDNVYIELVGSNTLNATATEDLDAAIYSKADLVISGSGSVEIISSIDGIHGKDDVEINGGTITVKAQDDGIVGKDSLKITDGKITISAQDHGLKTANGEEKGDMEITGGTISITTAEGDALHSVANLKISGGDLSLAAADDGIHADGGVSIEGGKVNVSKSYEALEGTTISISGGELSLTASDDGINAAGDACTGSFGMMGRGAMSSDGSSASCALTIAGGTVYVNAGGDGLDANGNIYMSGGTVHVDGSTDNGNAALDYDGSFEITGGELIAVGYSGMAMNATSSNQASVLINLSSVQNGEFSFGEITYEPAKSYNSVMISSPKLKVGETYELKVGGSSVQSVTISDNITGSGSGGFGPGGSGGGSNGGMMPGERGGDPGAGGNPGAASGGDPSTGGTTGGRGMRQRQ